MFSKALGPNPWKSAIVLEELGLQYENRFIEAADVKKRPYLDLNPNGRVPCIEDPNTGMVLWESAAINEYLVHTYDRTGTLWCPEGPDHFVMKQWLYFQMSGQGPYYGQGSSVSQVFFDAHVPDSNSAAKQPLGLYFDIPNIYRRPSAVTDKKYAV